MSNQYGTVSNASHCEICPQMRQKSSGVGFGLPARFLVPDCDCHMSPPAPWLGEFLDRGGWSSATLFAGRPFHFHYESMVMKLLVLVDFPSMLAALPIGSLISPLMSAVHAGSFIGSYVGALIELVTASCQWLAVGFAVDRRLESRPWGTSVLRPVNKYFFAVVTFVLVLTVVAVPLINKRSQERGFQHGAISFH